MTCAALQTGKTFLATTLTHLDCQGQTIGAYGYGALADPASPVSLALTALLAIFVALFGIRLVLGASASREDVIGAAIRIGIVLTLATAWPAWRVVGYNLVLEGPNEIARAIGVAAGLPEGQTLIDRLQNTDDGIVAMTVYGTGRLTGGIIGNTDVGDAFHGMAIADQTGFGWGRIAFLLSVIAPWAITRIGAGLLLALAPLMAGLMLFSATTGIFRGWLRGLVFVALSSLALSVMAGEAIALFNPLIADMLVTRARNSFTPSAPTELIVLGLAMTVFSVGMMGLAARVAFFPHTILPGFLRLPELGSAKQNPWLAEDQQQPTEDAGSISRAQAIANAVAVTLRREGVAGAPSSPARTLPAMNGRDAGSANLAATEHGAAEALGSTYRRSYRRTSAAGTRRDTRA